MNQIVMLRLKWKADLRYRLKMKNNHPLKSTPQKMKTEKNNNCTYLWNRDNQTTKKNSQVYEKEKENN